VIDNIHVVIVWWEVFQRLYILIIFHHNEKYLKSPHISQIYSKN